MIRRLAMAATCGVALMGLGMTPAQATPASAAPTPLASAAATPFATSCPRNFYCRVNYYSDATHTTVVGGYTRPCGAVQVGWGMVSPWPLVIDEGTCA